MEKKLTSKVIDKGIIIDDVLYKPVLVDDALTWYKCDFCDYKPCHKQHIDKPHFCDAFGDDMALQRYGKITEIRIETSTETL